MENLEMVSREKDLLQAEKQKAEEISQSVTAMAEQQTVLLAFDHQPHIA